MTAGLLPLVKARFFTAAGLPLAGGLVYTYQAGTTTPLASYTDSTGLVANSNPVVLDSTGSANIWLIGNYKIVVEDSLGNVQTTTDNVISLSGAGNYVVDTGGANVYVVNPSPPNTAYTAGLTLEVNIANTNTGASTINVNGLGVKNITYADGTALSANALIAGSIVTLTYDGTQFRATNIINLGNVAITGGTINGTTIGATTPAAGSFTNITATTTSAGSNVLGLTLINASSTANTSTQLAFQPSATSGQAYQFRGTNDGSNNINLNLYASAAGSGILRARLPFAGGLIMADASGNLAAGTTNVGDINIPTGSAFRIAGAQVGSILQAPVLVSTGAYSNSATTFTLGSGIPANTQGVDLLDAAITPVSATSVIEVEYKIFASISASSGQLTAGIFQDSITNALDVSTTFCGNNAPVFELTGKVRIANTNTTARTYHLRVGCGSGSTYINGTTSSALGGGVLVSYIKVTELSS